MYFSSRHEFCKDIFSLIFPAPPASIVAGARACYNCCAMAIWIGLIFLALGISLAVIWWNTFVLALQGIVVLALLLGGVIAVLVGYSEIKAAREYREAVASGRKKSKAAKKAKKEKQRRLREAAESASSADTSSI